MNRQHEVTATFLANKHIGVYGVARKLGISQSHTSKLLKRSSVYPYAIRKQQTAQIRARMKALRAQGWTPKEIAADMGYSVVYVRQVVRGALG
jgi:transcriptional regulator